MRNTGLREISELDLIQCFRNSCIGPKCYIYEAVNLGQIGWKNFSLISMKVNTTLKLSLIPDPDWTLIAL